MNTAKANGLSIECFTYIYVTKSNFGSEKDISWLWHCTILFPLYKKFGFRLEYLDYKERELWDFPGNNKAWAYVTLYQFITHGNEFSTPEVYSFANMYSIYTDFITFTTKLIIFPGGKNVERVYFSKEYLPALINVLMHQIHTNKHIPIKADCKSQGGI